MWSLQEVIDRVKESEKFKAVREIYHDVELEPGELQGMEALYVKILGRCVATVESRETRSRSHTCIGGVITRCSRVTFVKCTRYNPYIQGKCGNTKVTHGIAPIP